MKAKDVTRRSLSPEEKLSGTLTRKSKARGYAIGIIAGQKSQCGCIISIPYLRGYAQARLRTQIQSCHFSSF